MTQTMFTPRLLGVIGGACAFVGAGLLGGLAGCGHASDTTSGSVRESDGADANRAAPADFWLSLTVAGPSRAGGLEETPRGLRPARYVLETDRILRSAVGHGASEDGFPPGLRRLSDEQVQRLWQILQRGALMNDELVSQPKGIIIFDVLPEKTMYVVNVFAEGVRRQLLIDGEDGLPDQRKAARDLADALAELSWMDDAPVTGEGKPR